MSVPASLTVNAYAKINLTLDVFSKRADGYHSIASILQAISLHDTLTLTHREEPGIGFTCDAPEVFAVPTDETNLVVRAAQEALAASEKTNTAGVAIHLTKRIPAQAGLGGGSSDAAATLVGVDALLKLELAPTLLHTLAAGLGSDVPFFLAGGAVTARGRGETLTLLPDIEPFWLVVVKPEENVSTGWAYNELDAVPDRASHRATRRMEEVIQAGDSERLIAWQSNDFELPVFTHFPRIAWLHDELRMARAVVAHLCGSGAAVYGIAESEVSAHQIAESLRRSYTHVFVARTLTRAESHPLASALPSDISPTP